ncbi:hypothetical protein [Mesorhizobium sp. M0571]|uniref:hypothetical protein n=1 Tax=Mesorhizobium sp. M0571 TaxID=2956960 RepID=UPI003337489A
MGSAAPAWVVKAFGVVAVLTALGRVDAIETNPLACNLYSSITEARPSMWPGNGSVQFVIVLCWPAVLWIANWVTAAASLPAPRKISPKRGRGSRRDGILLPARLRQRSA